MSNQITIEINIGLLLGITIGKQGFDILITIADKAVSNRKQNFCDELQNESLKTEKGLERCELSDSK